MTRDPRPPAIATESQCCRASPGSAPPCGIPAAPARRSMSLAVRPGRFSGLSRRVGSPPVMVFRFLSCRPRFPTAGKAGTWLHWRCKLFSEKPLRVGSERKMTASPLSAGGRSIAHRREPWVTRAEWTSPLQRAAETPRRCSIARFAGSTLRPLNPRLTPWATSAQGLGSVVDLAGLTYGKGRSLS